MTVAYKKYNFLVHILFFQFRVVQKDMVPENFRPDLVFGT